MREALPAFVAETKRAVVPDDTSERRLREVCGAHQRAGVTVALEKIAPGRASKSVVRVGPHLPSRFEALHRAVDAISCYHRVNSSRAQADAYMRHRVTRRGLKADFIVEGKIIGDESRLACFDDRQDAVGNLDLRGLSVELVPPLPLALGEDVLGIG